MQNTPDPGAPLSLWIIAIATAFVTLLDLILRYSAPRTKTTLDDRALTSVERLLGWLKKLSPLGILAVIILGALLPAMLACKTVGPVAENAIENAPTIDCTILDKSKLDLAKDGITHVLAADPGNWTAAAEAALGYGVSLGGCELAKLVQDALSAPASNRTASRVERLDALDALEQFRSTHAGGATFHTEAGDL